MTGAFWLLFAEPPCPPSEPALRALTSLGRSQGPWAFAASPAKDRAVCGYRGCTPLPQGLPSSAHPVSGVRPQGLRGRARQLRVQGRDLGSQLRNLSEPGRDRVFTLMRKAWEEGEMSPCPEWGGCYCWCFYGDYPKDQPPNGDVFADFCFCWSLWSVLGAS